MKSEVDEQRATKLSRSRSAVTPFRGWREQLVGGLLIRRFDLRQDVGRVTHRRIVGQPSRACSLVGKVALESRKRGSDLYSGDR